MENRPPSEYAQSGSQPSHPPPADTHSENPPTDQAPTAAPAQYTQPEVRPTGQYTPQPDSRSAANISSSNTPQSDYGLNQPPPAARSPYPEYLARPSHYPAPNTQAGGAAGMPQATSPFMNTLNDGQPNHRDHSNVKSDADVPIDPSIAASSPTYPPPYSPYQPQAHEMAHYQGHPHPPPPPQMYGRPDWPPGYGPHQHGLPTPYAAPATTVGPSPAVTAGPRPGQVCF